MSEIIQAIAAQSNGITLGNLLRMFNDRIDKPGSTTKGEWIQMVKSNADYNAQDKLLRPKGSSPSA